MFIMEGNYTKMALEVFALFANVLSFCFAFEPIKSH